MCLGFMSFHSTFLFSVKKTCLNYRAFDLEDDLVGVPNAWNVSFQSFITLSVMRITKKNQACINANSKQMYFFKRLYNWPRGPARTIYTETQLYRCEKGRIRFLILQPRRRKMSAHGS